MHDFRYELVRDGILLVAGLLFLQSPSGKWLRDDIFLVAGFRFLQKAVWEVTITYTYRNASLICSGLKGRENTITGT